MRTTTILAYLLLSALLTACSGVDIEPSSVDQFAAGNYKYYKWRTTPLPPNSTSSDPFYAIDPVMRREVNAGLQARGYILDKARAQFSVDYLYGIGMREGAQSEQASNISPVPSVTPNRQVDQASVDNAIALGGVKETSNILLQFNDMDSNALMSPGNMRNNLTVGTARDVIDKIKRYEDLGYDEYSFWIDSGMSHERKRASLERFLNDVIPAFE